MSDIVEKNKSHDLNSINKFTQEQKDNIKSLLAINNEKRFVFRLNFETKNGKMDSINTVDELIQFAEDWNGRERVFTTISTFKENSANKTEKNAQVLKLIFLDIDVNLDEAKGETLENIDDQVKKDLKKGMGRLLEELHIESSFKPYAHFSGSKGFHVLLPVNLELIRNRDKIKDIWKKFCQYIEQQFFPNPKIEVDLKVCEFSRLVPIPYTIHMKSKKLVQPIDEYAIFERSEDIEIENWRMATAWSKKYRHQDKSNADPHRKSDLDLDQIAEVIRPYYTSGKRHVICMAIAGWFRRYNIAQWKAEKLVKQITSITNDSEPKDRLNLVKLQYKADLHQDKVYGKSKLLDIFEEIDYDNAATDINKINRLLGHDRKDNIRHFTTDEILEGTKNLELNINDMCDIRSYEKDGKDYWSVVRTPDRLALKLINTYDLILTEMSLHYFDGEISRAKAEDFIRKKIHEYFGKDSYWNEWALKKEWNQRILPEVLLTSDFKSQVLDAVDSRLDQESYNDAFNPLSWKDDDYILAFNNGGYHFNSDQLLPFEKEYRLANKLGADFVRLEDNPKVAERYADWITYVKTLVDTEEDEETLQEAAGYLLPFVYTGKKIIMLKGPQDSGKSTFFNILRRVISVQNTSSINLHMLMKDSFTLAQLPGKSVNFCGDLDESNIDDLGNLLRISGKDPVYANLKHQTGTNNVYIQTKMALTVNRISHLRSIFKPEVLTRFLVIPIKKPIEKMIKEYDEGWKDPEAIQAIAQWMLEGFKRYRSKGWTHPQDVETVRKIFEQEKIEVIFEELCELDEVQDNLPAGKEFAPSTTNSLDFYAAYLEHAKKWGLTIDDIRKNTRRLNAFFKYNYEGLITWTRRMITDSSTGKRTNCFIYTGFKLKGKKETNKETEEEIKKKLPFIRKKAFICQIIQQLTVEDHVPTIEEIHIEAKKEYITEAETDKALTLLMQAGKIYEPRPGTRKAMSTY